MNDRVVIFVGVLSEYQGIDLLLEAIPLVVREVPEVKFLIVGYPGEQVYREGRARWVWRDGPTSPAGFLTKRCRVISRWPTLRFLRKFPPREANLKLFTYMAMGLPTVVFDNPINREILDDLGVYAKNGDVESLAAALIQCSSRQSMGSTAWQAKSSKGRRTSFVAASGQAIGRHLQFDSPLHGLGFKGASRWPTKRCWLLGEPVSSVPI